MKRLQKLVRDAEMLADVKAYDAARRDRALQHWQDALTAGIAEVSEDELDRIVQVLCPDA